MGSGVLDASALLALLNNEMGSNIVATGIQNGACISTVNFSEGVAKLADAGMPESDFHEALDGLGLTVVAMDNTLAYQCGLLRPSTHAAELSS